MKPNKQKLHQLIKAPLNQKGITLLVGIIVASLLFLVSMAIANITLKQIIFSSVGRESQFAFYAADSGIECALFWDLKNPAGGSAFVAPGPHTINCNNQTFNIVPTLVGSDYVSTFTVTFSPEPYCVTVEVTKESDEDTHIDSRGYNTCDPNSPRRVERGVEVDY